MIASELVLVLCFTCFLAGMFVAYMQLRPLRKAQEFQTWKLKSLDTCLGYGTHVDITKPDGTSFTAMVIGYSYEQKEWLNHTTGEYNRALIFEHLLSTELDLDSEDASDDD